MDTHLNFSAKSLLEVLSPNRMSPASSQISFIQIGQHGDSKQGPDEAQAVLITNLQKENSRCFHLLLRKQATALYFPTATPKQVGVVARRCPAAFLGTLPGRAVAPEESYGEEGADPTSALPTPDTERSSSPSCLRQQHPRLL